MLEKPPVLYLALFGRAILGGLLHHAAYNFDDEIAPSAHPSFARYRRAANHLEAK